MKKKDDKPVRWRDAGPALPAGSCFICGERCAPFEKNTDGTYAHGNCLKLYQQRPSF